MPYFNLSKPRHEFANWMIEFAQTFRNQDTYQIYIIAPNVYNNKNVSFQVKGTALHYYFYKHTINCLHRKLVNHLAWNYRTNFKSIKKRISKIVNTINPDLIHLFGAENPYYSTGILPLISKYNTLISIQGMVKNTINPTRYRVLKNIEVEREIISKAKNIGILSAFVEDEVRSINQNCRIFKHDYQRKKPEIIRNENYKSTYDCVFFSRVTKDKGVEDLIQAVSMAKDRISEISLKIIGKISLKYRNYLIELSKNYGISDNVIFTGQLPGESLFKVVAEAKVFVLPTYADVMPGAVLECMYMKLPVIAYNVDGLPDLNDEENCIFLVEKGNINELAIKIVEILKEKKLEQMLHSAHQRSKRYFDSKHIYYQLDTIYKQIITE